jgi:hypothetical protein
MVLQLILSALGFAGEKISGSPQGNGPSLATKPEEQSKEKSAQAFVQSEPARKQQESISAEQKRKGNDVSKHFVGEVQRAVWETKGGNEKATLDKVKDMFANMRVQDIRSQFKFKPAPDKGYQKKAA